MSDKDKMSSVGEILKSGKFVQQAPSNFEYQIRKARRDGRDGVSKVELTRQKENQSIKDFERRRYR